MLNHFSLKNPWFLGGIALGSVVGFVCSDWLSEHFFVNNELPEDSLAAYNRVIKRLSKLFLLSDQKLLKIKEGISIHMLNGLAKDGCDLKMLPTFVDTLPIGTEEGESLVFHLGEKEFKLVLMRLDGLGQCTSTGKKFPLAERVRNGTLAELLAQAADCIVNFYPASLVKETPIMPLSFTICFPVKQSSLNSGCIIHWSKEFTVTDYEGVDLVKGLQQALDKKVGRGGGKGRGGREKGTCRAGCVVEEPGMTIGARVKVVALVNDTTATLVGGAISDSDCRIGLIVGRGTNLAYMEKTANIYKASLTTASGDMVINMELGGFDNDGTTITPTIYDDIMDNHTSNAGYQRFEKMISGQYLGELTRVVIKELAREGLLLRGKRLSDILETPWTLDIMFMSVIESDHSANLYKVKKLFEHEMGMMGTCSFSDRLLIKKICELVSTRSAMLVGCSLAAVADNMGVAG
eukprot:Ihof_evm5s23 gene=Ihof_evmTU5s23